MLEQFGDYNLRRNGGRYDVVDDAGQVVHTGYTVPDCCAWILAAETPPATNARLAIVGGPRRVYGNTQGATR